MSATQEWTLRVASGLAAHFKQPDGPSEPGVVWSVQIARGDERYTAMVKTLFAADATRATRRDDRYQSQTAMQYLNDRLRQGWHPVNDEDHTIVLGNPLAGAGAPAAGKPWWRFWSS